MTKKMYFIYDDLKQPQVKLTDVIGNSRFSEIIYKRKSFKSITFENVERNSFVSTISHLKNRDEILTVKDQFAFLPVDTKIIHIFSDSIITNSEEFNILINKLYYSNSNIAVADESDCPLMLFFTNKVDYINYLEIYPTILTTDLLNIFKLQTVKNTCFCSISNYRNLVSYLSGSFNTRYFNILSGDEHTVTKKSGDKIKMKKEYNFYYFLPEDMCSWFVQPYNYQEGEDYAYYSMQRYNMTDMAIHWVHKSVSLKEFDLFLKKAFQFISHRKKKTVSLEEYESVKNDLYIEKLIRRIEELKQHKEFPTISAYIKNGTNYESIDEIIAYYKIVYTQITNSFTSKNSLVIGHGDFCFSNILYDRHSELFRLVDPKGALNEKDIWTDEYYDIAKLSHSVCGLYDFFNNDLYTIELQQSLKFKLNIDFKDAGHKELFKKYLIENGFDYQIVRLYEASLFLSMLPLHMDYPLKVFGFLLNGINILKDIEKIQKHQI